MRDRSPDQAAGLRRLLRRDAVRVLPVLDDAGDERAMARIAEALAGDGDRVAVLDEAALAVAGFNHAPCDLVLVRASRPSRLGRIVAPDADVLVVVGSTRAELATAYRSLKLAAREHRSFRIVVNGSTDASAAMRTYRRIAVTTERFLGLVPAFAGFLPAESIVNRDRSRSTPERVAVRLAADVDDWRLAVVGVDGEAGSPA